MPTLTEEIAGYELPRHVHDVAETLEVEPLKVADLLLKTPKEITVSKPSKDSGLGIPVKSIPGHKWAPQGCLEHRGPRPDIDVMVIGTDPSKVECDYGQLFIDEAGRGFTAWLRDINMHPEDYYYTNVMRWPRSSNSVLVWEWKENAWFLHHEIKLCNPDYLLLMGTQATQKILGLKVKKIKGQAREIELPYGVTCTAVCTESYKSVHRDPYMKSDFLTDVSILKSLKETGSTPGELDTSGYEYIYNIDDLSDRVDSLIDESNRRSEEGEEQQLYSIDLEWGKEDDEDIIRTFQLSWEIGKSIVVVLRDQYCKDSFDPNVEAAWEELRRLLLRDEVRIIGQGFRGAEAPHLLDEMGYSLMDKLEIDSMLADHLMEENTTCALSRMNLRYTNMGPYDQPLHEYMNEHGLSMEKEGVKYVPEEELLKYAAADTDCVLRCWDALKDKLDEGQLELFFNTIMPSQMALWEIEQEGLYAHEDRMIEFSALFNDQAKKMKKELQEKVKEEVGFEEYNPNSWEQNGKVLFELYDMTPIMTTNKKDWDKVSHLSKEEREAQGINPKTDQKNLAMLDQDYDNQLPSMIADYKVIAKVGSNKFKPYDVKDGKQVPRKKSLHYSVEEDGRVHTHLLCLTKTGRRSSVEPNLQNIANRKMSRYRKIFDRDIPEIRSCLGPPEGWLMVENDFAQAELCVLAYLSEDENLIGALEDPDRDIHAERAIDMFDLDKPSELRQDNAPDGAMWSDAVDINPKKWCKRNGYGAQRNAAKAPTFGWSYLISPFMLWAEMREEGVECTIEDTTKWLDQLDKEYPEAAKFQEKQSKKAEDPGFVVTPWKRKKHLYIMDDDRGMNRQSREAANFAIQSTVADLLSSTLIKARKVREEMGLNNKLCLELHDAMYNFVKPEELDVFLNEYIPEVTNITIPELGATLDYESSIYTHNSGWDVTPSKEELEKLGVTPDLAEKYGKYEE